VSEMHTMTKEEYGKLLEDLVIRKHQVMIMKKMLLDIYDKLLPELPPENDAWSLILSCLVSVFNIEKPYTHEKLMETLAKARMELKEYIISK
jgi:hypothetical protein